MKKLVSMRERGVFEESVLLRCAESVSAQCALALGQRQAQIVCQGDIFNLFPDERRCRGDVLPAVPLGVAFQHY